MNTVSPIKNVNIDLVRCNKYEDCTINLEFFKKKKFKK